MNPILRATSEQGDHFTRLQAEHERLVARAKAMGINPPKLDINHAALGFGINATCCALISANAELVQLMDHRERVESEKQKLDATEKAATEAKRMQCCVKAPRHPLLAAEEPKWVDCLKEARRLEAVCGELRNQLAARGQPVEKPTALDESDLSHFQRLEIIHDHHVFLQSALAQTMPAPPTPAQTEPEAGKLTWEEWDRLTLSSKCVVARNGIAPPTPPGTEQPAAQSETAQAQPALTSEEIAKLTWTERCELAGGYLGITEARERIAARVQKKQTNLTELCRKQKTNN